MRREILNWVVLLLSIVFLLFGTWQIIQSLSGDSAQPPAAPTPVIVQVEFSLPYSRATQQVSNTPTYMPTSTFLPTHTHTPEQAPSPTHTSVPLVLGVQPFSSDFAVAPNRGK